MIIIIFCQRAFDHECLGLVHVPDALRLSAVSISNTAAAPAADADAAGASAIARPKTPLQNLARGSFHVIEVRVTCDLMLLIIITSAAAAE